MKHLITNIDTYIQDREQCVAFQVEGREEPIKAQFKVVKKLVGQISILEIEVLLNSFCEPSSFFKKGETMPNGRKASVETKFPKTWKITLDGALDELRLRNRSYLLDFQTIYDTYIFENKNKQLAVRVRTTENNIYFYQLNSLERIVGIKQDEFNFLRGGFISPVMYKKGDYSEYFGKFTAIKEDNKIVANFNFRVDETIENNFNLYGNQKLKNKENYWANQRYGGDDNNDESYQPSYKRYNGYNGFDDDTIDNAFEGDPDATWNVD